MKKRTKRNKPHRPRDVSAVGGLFAIQQKHDDAVLQQPMDDEQTSDLARVYRMAFTAMITGNASEQNWSTCVCSLNVGLILAEHGIGRECIPEFNAALEGAFRAKVRASRISAWGFDGPAIQAIKAAFETHESQLDFATKQEIRDALMEVRRRIDVGDVFREAA